MRKLKSRGAALVDYGLIIGLVSIVAIGAVNSTGEKTETIYCMASNGLARVTGADLDPNCVLNPRHAVTLAEGERFVTAPRRMEAAFTDVTFPNDNTGEHLVLSQVAAKPDARYSLKTSIASRDAYDPDRTISSCYLLSDDIDPICSTPSDTSTVWVPAEAEAIGYSISLSEDKDMPWTSDVTIAVPQDNAAITIADGSWNVVVSRANPTPKVENIAFEFTTPYSFQREDAGWTYGEFAAIEGKFNQNLTFEMTNIEGETRYRKACYKGTPTSQPVCSSSTASNSISRITVPAGVAQVGYEVELPAKRVGADWSVRETFQLREGAVEKHRQDVTIVRPSEPYSSGSMATSFSTPYRYKQTDTGWVDGEFITLTGGRNVDLTLRVTKSGSETTNRKACYKLVAGGVSICGTENNTSFGADVVVPKGAVEVGYQVQLGATSVGPDWTADIGLSLSSVEKTLFTGTVTLIRPNEAYSSGSMATAFTTPYRYKQTDTGWVDGEFIALSSGRNVDLSLRVSKTGSVATTRKGCYKLVTGGTSICGPADSGNFGADIVIPKEAVEVGYQVQLGATAVGADWTADIYLNLGSVEKSLFSGAVTVIRPNATEEAGTLAASFTTPYRYKQTDTGWVDGEFVALAGSRNTELTLAVGKSGSVETTRKACYKLAAGGASICGVANSSYFTAYATVPVEAVSVGYQVQLGAEAIGADWTADITVGLTGASKTLYSGTITLIRPNQANSAGAISAPFSNPYYYAKTDGLWADGEFVTLTGQRNVNLLFTVSNSGTSTTRKACYKLVAGGASTCGSENSNYYGASISVPTNAVSVGYQVQLPSAGPGPNWTAAVSLSLSGGGTTLYNGTVNLIRENDPYQPGSLASQYSTPYSFAQSDTGMTYGQFIGLNGPRNVNLYYTMDRKSNSDYSKAPCYKLVAGGPATCSTMKTGTGNYLWVPQDAVEIGYVMQLPAAGVGPAALSNQQMYLSGGGAVLLNQEIQIQRPNAPYESGSLMSEFSPTYNYPATTVGATDGEYVALSGTHNHSLTFTITMVSGSPLNRRACYRMVAGGTATCGSNAYNTTAATISVPVGAVEVGYRFDYGTTGSDQSGVQKMKITGQGTTLIDKNVTVNRPAS
jgi:Flp pilus assembly pilin Flp